MMRHILFTLKGCPYGLLDDEAHIRNVLANAATLSESTLLGVQSHKFQPQGVTAVALLAESHISIHTWPENGMAVCDVFTCGEHTNPRSGATYMYEAMGATDLVSEIFIRPLKCVILLVLRSIDQKQLKNVSFLKQPRRCFRTF